MDPSGGGVSEAAKELLEEMKQAQEDMQKLSKPGQTGGPNEAFQEAMQAAQTNQAQAVKAPPKASEILNSAKIGSITDPKRLGNSAVRVQKSGMAKVIEDLVQGQDKMTNIMNMALSGRQFSPPELLAMQAGVYRFSQELELTSKVVEKATSGVKQTMNTQV